MELNNKNSDLLKVDNDELTDDELSLVIGGAPYDIFNIWKEKILNSNNAKNNRGEDCEGKSIF